MKVHQKSSNDVGVILPDTVPDLVVALLNLVPLASRELAVGGM